MNEHVNKCIIFSVNVCCPITLEVHFLWSAEGSYDPHCVQILRLSLLSALCCSTSMKVSKTISFSILEFRKNKLEGTLCLHAEAQPF